ncbi:MAG: hypothetical protein LLG16_03715 [Euryarchaeota archaeon]|nr:hypothetical protein [Euryarchaeota archaeon]
MRRTLATLASLITAIILLNGAGAALFRGDIYWAVVAIWSFALILLPFISRRRIDRASVHWMVPFTILPYLIGLMVGISDRVVIPTTSDLYWLLSSIAIFSLCLVTVADIGSYSRMRMNLNFAMITTFILYETVIIVQGPVYYYSDLWMGTDLVHGNTDLMAYVIFTTVFGLVMTVVFNYTVKRTRLVENIDDEVDGESS